MTRINRRPRLRSQAFWARCLVGIVTTGILSRVVHTGLVVFDKYMGDVLYAAMVYAILRLLSTKAVPVNVALTSLVVMTGIELFQLTLIPANLAASENGIARIFGQLLGTQFSFLDLLAYTVGIGGAYLADFSHWPRAER